MAIVKDATGTVSTQQGSGLSTHTASYTVSAGSDRCLVVRLQYVTSNQNNTITSVTYGGVAMTLVGESFLSTFPDELVAIWRLINPTVGTANVVATNSGGATLSLVYSFIDAWTEVHQTVSFGSSTSAESTTNNTTPSVNVTSVAGDKVLDVFGSFLAGAYTITKDASQTLDGEFEANDGAGASSETASGTSTTMSWTLSAGALWWTIGAAMKPAAGGGGGTPLSVFLEEPIIGGSVF